MATPKRTQAMDQYIGSRVRMGRAMLSMSQEKLGEALGVTFQQVQKYEKGANRIGAGTLLQLSSVLQVPVTFFFEGAPRPSDRGIEEEGALTSHLVTQLLGTPEGVRLARAFVQIKDEKVKNRIAALAEELTDESAG